MTVVWDGYFGPFGAPMVLPDLGLPCGRCGSWFYKWGRTLGGRGDSWVVRLATTSFGRRRHTLLPLLILVGCGGMHPIRTRGRCPAYGVLVR